MEEGKKTCGSTNSVSNNQPVLCEITHVSSKALRQPTSHVILIITCLSCLKINDYPIAKGTAVRFHLDMRMLEARLIGQTASHRFSLP